MSAVFVLVVIVYIAAAIIAGVNLGLLFEDGGARDYQFWSSPGARLMWILISGAVVLRWPTVSGGDWRGLSLFLGLVCLIGLVTGIVRRGR